MRKSIYPDPGNIDRGKSGGRFSLYYSEDIIEQVRSSSDIVDIISGYVKLQKKGNSYFGLCPFHSEKTPSFSVSRDKQMYYCFGCGAGGNVFTFLMEYENFTFQEALSFLAERAGITLPAADSSREEREKTGRKQKILEVNKEAAKYYYALLMSERGKIGLDYFLKRGLTRETIRAFGLGYSDKYSNGLYRYMKKKGYEDALLRDTGLFLFDEKRGMTDKFWNRVMFPIMDINNRVIAFGGRVMGDAKPKYLNSPETEVFDKSRNLYGLNIARKDRSKSLILCEGYMDVIAMHQGGFTSAVASLGTAFTTGQASLLKRYAEQIYLVYDSDGAGVKAILRALPILRQTGLDGKVVRLEPYKDPDEFIGHLGADAFRERIESAENGFLFALSAAEKDFDMNSPEGRTRFFHKAAEELLIFDEEIERNNYIQAVARKYQVSAENLKQLVNQEAMKGVRDYPGERQPIVRAKKEKPPSDEGVIQAQKLLLTWIIERPGVFPTIRRYVFPEDFTTELYRQVAALLYQQEEEGNLNPARIISRFENEKDQKEAAALFNAKLPRESLDGELEKILKETVVRVKRASVERMNKELDPSDINAVQEMIRLRKALQDLEKTRFPVE